MSNSIYAALNRQVGLAREIEAVANNIANANTTGYKADRAIFAELVVPTASSSGPISMGNLAGQALELSQGAFQFTQGRLDLAIDGEGFFQIETPQGNRLTRAGHFSISPNGTLADNNGNPLLGQGGNPITIPETATDIAISPDGTLTVDGQIVDQIGVFTTDGQLLRDTATHFTTDGNITEAEASGILQGAVEQSNVSPVLEIARMIEVQRAYEAGQALLERDDERLSQLVSAIRNR